MMKLKMKFSSKNEDRVTREVKILKKCTHRNVIIYKNCFKETPPTSWQESEDLKNFNITKEDIAASQNAIRQPLITYNVTDQDCKQIQKDEQFQGAFSDVGKQLDLELFKSENQQRKIATRHIWPLLANQTISHSYFYIAMEACYPFNLQNLLQVNNTWQKRSLLKMTEFFTQICSGCEYLHDRNIVHRDLAARNILFSVDDLTVKISDFGLAREMVAEDGSAALDLTNFRTNYNLAPELAVSKAYDDKSDLYSMGILLLEMLTPRPHWTILARILRTANELTKVPQSLTNHLPKMANIILRLIDHDPDIRMTAADLCKMDLISLLERRVVKVSENPECSSAIKSRDDKDKPGCSGDVKVKAVDKPGCSSIVEFGDGLDSAIAKLTVR